MANEFKVKKGLIVNGDGGTVVDIQGNSGQLFSVTDSLLGILMSVNDITGIPILQVSSDDTVRMGPYGNPFIVNAIGLSVGTNLVIDSLGNIKFDGTPTTTNQNRGIYWTAYDKEGTTDPSDAAYIRHTTNSGGLAGSVIEISSQNDADDGVNFLVNSTASGVRINGNAVLNAGNYNSYSPTLTGGGASGTWGISISGNSATTSQTNFSALSVNGNTVWHAGNDGTSSGLDADLLDGYQSSISATPSTVAVRDSSGDITVRELVLNVAVQDFTPSSLVAIYPTTNQAVKVTAGGARTFLNVPTRTGGDASGTWGINITGNSNNITQYTINQNLGTGDSPTFGQVYNNGWFRNNANNTGLYNENTTQHLSSNTNGYWDVSSTTNATTGVVGIRLYAGGHLNTLRGFFYSDDGGVGILNNQSGWSVRAFQGSSYGGILSNSWTASGDMRAPIFYDSANTAFFVDPASTSNLQGLTVVSTITGNISGNAASVTNGVYTTGDQTIGGNKTFNGTTNLSLLTIPQNPVGTTYGNGVSTVPPHMIAQLVGYDDGWRIYGESEAANQVRMVFELVDDIEEAYSDQWVFRNKLTYDTFGARNEFQISGTGNAQARSSLRAPIFYDSDNTNFYLDPASTSVLNTLNIGRINITSGDIRSAAASGWTGDPGAEGKIQYHSNRWYIVSDQDSNRIVQFRRNATDVSHIDNSGVYHGSITGNAGTLGTFAETSFVRLSANSSSPTNGNFAIGSASGRNFIQSHYGQPLDINPLGNSVTIGSTTTVSGAVISTAVSDTAFNRIVSPSGGVFTTTSSTVTGAIKIQLPVLGSGMMMSCTVKVYEYSVNKSFTITFGGHRDSANWYNEFCYLDGDSARGNLTVRFGIESDRNCVWIGETNTVWSYPQVFVTDLQLGYAGFNSTWLSGWAVTFATSLGTINRTQTAYLKITPQNYNSYSPTLTGGGASGTWGINISGNSATTSQTTFSRVRTDGINRGSYGAISISGSENGYSGIDFTAASSTFMVKNSDGLSGIYRNDNTWLWYFDGAGALTIGTVPWARITGQPSLVTGTGASGQVSYWNGTTTQAGNNGLWWDNGNGRLGINTTSPQARLHVSGTVRIDSTSSGPEAKDPTTVKYVLTNLDNGVLMGEPNIWLQINVNGTNYVFPGYIPFGIS